MREDLLEQIEKMFPNGYLILYPTDNQRDVRMSYHLPTNAPACQKLYNAIQILEENNAENR